MDVILLSDVEKVGLRGDVVAVADGYARNFLIPRKLAERATSGKVAELQRIEQRRARHEAATADQAQQIAGVLEQTVLRFDVKAGPTGVLFGSVTPTNVADELWSTKKIRVDRRKIGLDDTIKRIGRYQIPIELFDGVTVDVRTEVVPEGEELPPEEELQAMVAAEEAAAAEAAAAEAPAEVEYFDEDVAVAETTESAPGDTLDEGAAVDEGAEPGAADESRSE